MTSERELRIKIANEIRDREDDYELTWWEVAEVIAGPRVNLYKGWKRTRLHSPESMETLFHTDRSPCTCTLSQAVEDLTLGEYKAMGFA